MFESLTSGLWYVGFFAIIMLVAGFAKRTGFFVPVYKFFASKIKSRRAIVALISCVSGVLPIEGRAVVSAGWLDTLAPRDKRRKIYGIVDYLSTHHYYFWSPLEQTVLLPLATLGISYWVFLGMIWPLLATMLAVTLFYIFVILKEEDVVVDLKVRPVNNDKLSLFEIFDMIKWDTLFYVAFVIVLGNFLKLHSSELVALIKATGGSLLVANILAFMFSFLLGSSSKYIGFAVILTQLFGINYFPIFFAVSYAGYMVSPTHKCTIVAKTYFGTEAKKFYSVIGVLCLLIVLSSVVKYFIG